MQDLAHHNNDHIPVCAVKLEKYRLVWRPESKVSCSSFWGQQIGSCALGDGVDGASKGVEMSATVLMLVHENVESSTSIFPPT